MKTNTIYALSSMEGVTEEDGAAFNEKYQQSFGNYLGKVTFAQEEMGNEEHGGTAAQFNSVGNGVLYVQEEYGDFCLEASNYACCVDGCPNHNTIDNEYSGDTYYVNHCYEVNEYTAFEAYPKLWNEAKTKIPNALHLTITFTNKTESSYCIVKGIGTSNVYVTLYFASEGCLHWVSTDEYCRYYDSFTMPNYLIPIVEMLLYKEFVPYCEKHKHVPYDK